MATSLLKSGNGTWQLGNNNSYSGGTTIDAGTLLVNAASGVGVGSVYVNGGQANFAATSAAVGNVYLNGGSTIGVGATNALGAANLVATSGTMVTLAATRPLPITSL